MRCVKRRFRDEIAALHALGRIAAAVPDERRPKRPIRAYHCQHCRGWHLTSQEKRDAA